MNNSQTKQWITKGFAVALLATVGCASNNEAPAKQQETAAPKESQQHNEQTLQEVKGATPRGLCVLSQEIIDQTTGTIDPCSRRIVGRDGKLINKPAQERERRCEQKASDGEQWCEYIPGTPHACVPAFTEVGKALCIRLTQTNDGQGSGEVIKDWDRQDGGGHAVGLEPRCGHVWIRTLSDHNIGVDATLCQEDCTSTNNGVAEDLTSYCQGLLALANPTGVRAGKPQIACEHTSVIGVDSLGRNVDSVGIGYTNQAGQALCKYTPEQKPTCAVLQGKMKKLLQHCDAFHNDQEGCSNTEICTYKALD